MSKVLHTSKCPKCGSVTYSSWRTGATPKPKRCPTCKIVG